MRKISVLIVGLSTIFLMACGSADYTGQAKTPSGSDIQKGRTYTEVQKDFEENGFTNIQTEKIEDLITGWLTQDGEVEKVSVGGNEEYSPDKWVDADTEVIIYYHTFPADEETTEEVQEIEETDEVAEETENTEETSERQMKSGYSTSTVIQVGSHTFTIPDYWIAENADSNTYMAVAENVGKTAVLYIQSILDEEDPVTEDILTEQTEQGLMKPTFEKILDDISDVEYEKCDYANVWGYKYSFTGTNEGLGAECICFVFTSFDDNSWVYMYLVQTDNTDYDYSDEFENIIFEIDSEQATTTDDTVSSIQSISSGMDRDDAYDCMYQYIENRFTDVKIKAEYGHDEKHDDDTWYFSWPVTYTNIYGTKIDATVTGFVEWDGADGYYIAEDPIVTNK